MILVKKVGSQESGYSGGTPNQRGSYLLISKGWLEYFPALSTTAENDAALVVLEVFPRGRVVLPFVWHNSRVVHGRPNGRNEYRLYTAGMERSGIALPEPNDLAVLEPLDNGNGGKFRDHFRFRVVRRGDFIHDRLMSGKSSSSNYWKTTVDWSSLGTSVEVCPNIGVPDLSSPPVAVPALDSTVGLARTAPSDSSSQPSVVLNSVSTYLAKTPAEVLAMRTSDQTFREVVLSSYGCRCAITGKALSAGEYLNLEAAHIKPQAHKGPNLPGNGIALCRDLHWGFDKGTFTITDDFTVEVHPSLKDTDWGEYHGRKIAVPGDRFYQPSAEFLRHHRARVYGQFHQAGALRRLVG
jgi:hypothetical protein